MRGQLLPATVPAPAPVPVFQPKPTPAPAPTPAQAAADLVAELEPGGGGGGAATAPPVEPETAQVAKQAGLTGGMPVGLLIVVGLGLLLAAGTSGKGR